MKSQAVSLSSITEGGTASLIALFAGATAIAFAPIFVRLSEVGPAATAFWRLTLALPALWLWVMFDRRNYHDSQKVSTKTMYGQLALAGLFFAGDLAVWHWSILFTSVANSTLLANFAPIFVALGAWLVFGQRVTRSFLMAMVLALIGTSLMVGSSLQMSLRHLWGDALGLITAVFYAGYILTVKQLREELSVATIMAWGGTVTALALFPLALLSDETIMPTTGRGWSVLLGLALISQVSGQSLIAYALAHLPAAFSSIGLLLQPVMATLFARQILGERLEPWQALGGILVLVGILRARQSS
jgi:drug/metabolite transporter (DMT)-like permease